MKWVIDASVAAKWFNLEEFSELAVEVKNAHVKGDLQLVAPIQIVYEVGNSIWKNPQIERSHASEAICDLLALHIELLEPDQPRTSRTMEIAKTRAITFYDSAYIQAAEEIGTCLLTADERQITAAKDIVDTIHIDSFWL